MKEAPAPLRIVAAGDTHIGGREHNEDAILLRPDLSLFLVADGAGGHNAGNIAAALATSATAHFFEETRREAEIAPLFDEMGLPTAARRLATAFQRANQEVIEVADASQRLRGMGTTLVAAYFDLHNASMVLGHVGDSRCYRMREGRLELLTQDHTLINDVLELQPDMDPERARQLPRNVITNALGMERTLRVSVRTHEVVPGDRYLLCSDGLTDEVDDGQISQALQLATAPDEQTRLLVDLATDGGARDNIAVLVLGVSLVPGIGKLPAHPVPPRRSYPDADQGMILEVEDDGELEPNYEDPEVAGAEVLFVDEDEPAAPFPEEEEATLVTAEDLTPVDEGAAASAEAMLLDAGGTEEEDALAAPLEEEDDDEPELEIVEEPLLGRRRRPDETVIRKTDE